MRVVDPNRSRWANTASTATSCAFEESVVAGSAHHTLSDLGAENVASNPATACTTRPSPSPDRRARVAEPRSRIRGHGPQQHSNGRRATTVPDKPRPAAWWPAHATRRPRRGRRRVTSCSTSPTSRRRSVNRRHPQHQMRHPTARTGTCLQNPIGRTTPQLEHDDLLPREQPQLLDRTGPTRPTTATTTDSPPTRRTRPRYRRRLDHAGWATVARCPPSCSPTCCPCASSSTWLRHGPEDQHRERPARNPVQLVQPDHR